MITASRYHDISCGHRVVGHEGKCRHLHGHNYRITFHCAAKHGLDPIGRVIDFGVIKSKLCFWLEDNWDHKMLLWEQDWMVDILRPNQEPFVALPFNPTAENMADYLLRVIAPQQLVGTGVECVSVQVEETRKCWAASALDDVVEVR